VRVQDPGASAGERPATESAQATATTVQATWAYRLAVPFRMTRRGAVTRGVAVCQKCSRILEPYERRRSKTGSHGEDFYVHEHPISAVVFTESNGGHRSHYFMGEKVTDDSVTWAVWMGSRLWTLDRTDIDEVVTTIRDILRGGE
jgi:hypothetical protein